MKRLPVIASFVLFLALCASIAYWTLELTKPALRPIAAPPSPSQPDRPITAGAGLFGGRTAVAVAANYQLKGVIVAGNPKESVAILSADGKPAQAVMVGREVMPGTTVQEVQARHVLLSEGGIMKRVELPEEVKAQSPAANPAIAAPGGFPAQRSMQPTPPQAAQQGIPPFGQAGQVGQPGRGQGQPQGMPQQPPGQQVPPIQQDGMPSPQDGVPQQQDGPPPGQQGELPPGFPPPNAMPPSEAIEPRGPQPEMQQ